MSLAFWFFIKSRKKQSLPTNSKPLDQNKIDQYFEELFARLDQNRIALEEGKNPTTKNDPPPIYDMTAFLSANLNSSKDWASFEHYFEKVHKDFFKNLRATYPTISPNELNICALIKLNLRNKDIAQVLGISHQSVHRAINRLAKKMDLPEKETLRITIMKF